MTEIQMEFDVEMKCDSCTGQIHSALQKIGLTNFVIDKEAQTVVLKTTKPFSEILSAIEATGCRAVLKGLGPNSNFKYQAAVAELHGSENLNGVVRFLQASPTICIVDGTIDGLTPGEHGLHIHQFGDLSNGYSHIGKHFDTDMNSEHGGRDDIKRHYGDLGNVVANEQGRSVFRFEDSVVKVAEIIGRSLAVCENRDDLGRGHTPQSKLDGNCGQILAAAVIAHSAGLFQNPKRICHCDGVSIWDERNVPTAGEGRRNAAKNKL